MNHWRSDQSYQDRARDERGWIGMNHDTLIQIYGELPLQIGIVL